MKKVTVLLISTFLIIISCKKENTETIIPEIPQITITSSLYGQVIDESGAAIEDAEITVGNHHYSTDENGFFVFTDISMSEYGTYIKAEKEGYFLGAKFVEPRENSRAYTKIKLLERAVSGTISSENGGKITTNGNASVDFPSNAFQFENGENYSGPVNVFAKYLDPQSADIQETMPGDLRGSDRNGDFVQLATYGMIAVELETPDGEKLDLKSGKKATLEMPVPQDLLNNAPTSIPLWYLNEETGHWIEEGSANLENGIYVGEVAHFSFWNCDAPFPVIDFSGKLVDEVGNPFVNSLVKITINSSAFVGFGYTDSEGHFSGKVAKNEFLTLEIIGLCQEVIYSETIGPFSESTDLGSIIIENPDYYFIGFSGILINCDGDFVENGYAKLTMGTNEVLIFTGAAGLINTSLMVCGNELEVLAFDLDNSKMSEQTSFPISGSNNLDIGLFEVCDDIIEYLYFQVGDDNFTISDPSLYEDSFMIAQGILKASFTLKGEDAVGTQIKIMYVDPVDLTLEPGVYYSYLFDLEWISDSGELMEIHFNSSDFCLTNTNESNTQISIFEEQGGWVFGQFSICNILGQFRVIRD